MEDVFPDTVSVFHKPTLLFVPSAILDSTRSTRVYVTLKIVLSSIQQVGHAKYARAHQLTDFH